MKLDNEKDADNIVLLSAALQMATATDIQDIADILGVTFQEHCSATPLKAQKLGFSLFYHFVSYTFGKSSQLSRQVFPQEAPNSTNIDEVIKKAGDNDSELTEINLNNIKYISEEKWANLFKSLAENSNVESLSAANCNLTDPICNLLCNCLEVKI